MKDRLELYNLKNDIAEKHDFSRRHPDVTARISAEDDTHLDSPPVWDGMAAAESCLFVSCVDGRVAALAKGPAHQKMGNVGAILRILLLEANYRALHIQ